jgi:protein-tyrosine phosphatase
MYWITKNLATSSMSEFEYRKEEGVVVVDVRDLIDGEGNDETIFKQKVDKVDEFIKSGKKVCICCVGGQSRSNAVALAYLIKSGMSFEEAYKLIRKNPVSMIDMALMDLVWKIYVR